MIKLPFYFVKQAREVSLLMLQCWMQFFSCCPFYEAV